MNNMDMWSLIIGFVSATFILPLLQQPKWSTRVRASVTFVFSILAGLGNVYFNGTFNPHDISTSILGVLISAIAVYRGFSKPTGIAPAIEGATSPGA